MKTFTATQSGISQLGEYANMRAAADALPSGAYTTFRIYPPNRILRLNQHLTRLEDSLALMGHVRQLDRPLACDTIRAALRHADGAELRMRLTFAAAPQSESQFFATIEPFTPYPAELYRQGVACMTVPLRRENPLAKSTAFNTTASAAYKTLPNEIHEGLMVAEDGAILEGLSSNFFGILGNLRTLRTEEGRVLFGVTRALTLELAQAVLPVQRVAVNIADLAQLRECFITSVSREILPVVKINDQHIGDGTPGPITRELMQHLADLVAHEAQPV
ncbi:MAG: aminotransferase class IV [Anaerolineae bacterium]|nr:aminotransferase class IV [Anaerolineae bacterium]